MSEAQVPFIPADDATAAMIDFFGPPISVYTRSQALEDGVLVSTASLVPDEPRFALEAGWKVPVALTAALAALVVPTEVESARGQSVKGRLWDVLSMARMYASTQRRSDTVYFVCVFQTHGRPDHRGGRHPFHLKAVIGGGDESEPVLTLMFREED